MSESTDELTQPKQSGASGEQRTTDLESETAATFAPDSTQEEAPAAVLPEAVTNDASSADTLATQVYLGNLNFQATEEDLQDLGSRYGEVLSVQLAKTREGEPRGFAFLKFATPEQAAAMADGANGTTFASRELRARIATPKRPNAGDDGVKRARNPPAQTLYVGNLDYGMTDTQLNGMHLAPQPSPMILIETTELFRDIKNVLDVRVAIDRRTGRPRGFAHAEFADVDSAIAGHEALNGKRVGSRILRADYAPTRQARE